MRRENLGNRLSNKKPRVDLISPFVEADNVMASTLGTSPGIPVKQKRRRKNKKAKKIWEKQKTYDPFDPKNNAGVL